MQFSIRTLLLFTTAVAVTVASLTYANPIVGDLFYTLGLVTIAFVSLAAIYHRGSDRAFWVGFVVLFAGYLFHTIWPSELRETWGAMQRLGNFDFPVSSISTTRLLNVCFDGLHGLPATARSSAGSPYPNSTMWVTQIGNKYMAFMTIGHTSIAFLFGILGGVVAQRFASRSIGISAPPAESAERAAASPPPANSGEA